ncbi:hypothetical protein [Paenibacillus sp. NPDC057934]|uniref:hypothetical protein n=1 Tax=Paenibacillus sp. NPDC057934 TaxID=3346282 RepID=UPI0036DB4445
MRKHRRTYVAMLLSTFIISQLSAYSASAAPVNTTNNINSPTKVAALEPSTTTNLGSVQLGAGVNATLEDIRLWPQTGGNILTYTLNYANGGGSKAGLINYFSRVVTSGGTVIPGTPITTDALKKSIDSKQNLRVTYYVNVGKTNSLNGIKIAMHVWDAKAKGYLRQAGSISVPASYSQSTLHGKILNTTMSDIPVAASSESFQIYKYSSKVYAKIGLSVTNKGNKVLSDPGYKAYLVTASGTAFELALDSSQAGYKIQPQEKKTIYYLTEIPSYLKTDNMRLQFVQRDETLKVDLPQSAYKLPAATTPDLTVAKGVTKKIIINNNSVETQLSNAAVYAENETGMWTFQLRFKNTGNKAVTLPNYELTVKSAKGTSFPVNANGINGLLLKPLEEKVISLKAQIPLSVEQNTLQLQMIESVGSTPDKSISPDNTGSGGSDAGTGSGTGSNTAKLTIPVAYFSIPYTLRPDTQKGQDYRTTNDYGTFNYRLLSVQRFPWKDDDILVAKLNINNTQSVSLSLPDLKGSIKLDNNDIAGSTELFMDKEFQSLAPGKSADIYVMAKVPYTQKFDKLNINLYTTVKEENVSFLSLATDSMINAVAQIERGGSYDVIAKGKNAKVQENKTTIYEGINSNIVYSELLLSSEEKRQSKMARIQGYFATPNGDLFEAVSNQPDTSATPGGKQLVTFWAKVPKSVNLSDVALYLGPGITGNKLSEPGQEPTGFINIASLDLNPVATPPENNLSKVTLYPYTLSMLRSDGRNLLGTDTINIIMNYDLLRDVNYDMGTFNHKLVLKMTDPYGQSQEKNLTIGTDLTEGSNNTFSLSFSNTTYKKLVNGGAYRITLYDEFQGERIELASQAYTLYIDRTLTSDK